MWREVWCCSCEKYHRNNLNYCDGCIPILWSDDAPPTRYVKRVEPVKPVKEEKKMIVTIIGSLSKGKEMRDVKAHFEKLGCKVNYPLEESLQKLPLLEIQSTWIKKIREADLVVVVPKAVSLESHGGKRISMDVGESTSYEMAIAYDMNKTVIFA